MARPRFEVPSGVIDGVNTVFTVSRPYRAGTTAVFINGQLMERNLDDGWFETDPQAGAINLKEAPRSSGACPDVIQVFFIDTEAALPESQILKLKGRIRISPSIRASVRTSSKLRSRIKESARMTGRVDSRERLRGSVHGVQGIRATIKVCGD